MRLTPSLIALGFLGLVAQSCGSDDARTFASTGGSSGTSGGAGLGGGGGSDASAGTGGGDAGKSCSGNVDCVDENPCNGVESCVGSVCQPGTNLKDGTACGVEPDAGADAGLGSVCVAGACLASCKDDADCDDADACTGVESCNPSTKTCQSGTPPDCDDGSPCTENKCDPGTGCYNPLIDGDEDGHADEALGACGDDCNDEDKTIYKGAQELCDQKDNDCDGKIDGNEPTWYEDCDGDGFAPGSAQAVKTCTKPTAGPTACPNGGWTSTAPASGTTDCFDANKDVHPMTAEENNSAWHTTAIPGATTQVDFDYNCDGNEEKRFDKGFVSKLASCGIQCGGSGLCYCSGSAGYTAAAAACESSGEYTYCDIISCQRKVITKKQECR
ncbi:MAG: putative metal-binding motif-containing protein [Polyangiaceae bacterium]